VGYPEHDASWEPIGNLTNAMELVRNFDASRTMQPEGGSDVMVLHGEPLSRDQSHDLPGGLRGDRAHMPSCQVQDSILGNQEGGNQGGLHEIY